VFTILASVAELEHSTIRERLVAGQKAAKRRGVRFGQPTVEVDTDRAALLPTVLIYASVHASGCSQVFRPSHKKPHLYGSSLPPAIRHNIIGLGRYSHDNSPHLVVTPYGVRWFLVGGPGQPVIQQQHNVWNLFRDGTWLMPRIHLYSQSKAQAC
jgi:hypothetical protein